ncbi:hypothetical protein TUMSATVNIG1_15130 [Vibrio nigripulchritudo]|nr:hypothetical protein TUMSATVNIG1_15130 [Vibrio nigripulchritudo]
MATRLDYFNVAPEGFQILLGQENYLRAQFEQLPNLSVELWELVKLRVSQINQCAFCIDMHSKRCAKKRGIRTPIDWVKCVA